MKILFTIILLIMSMLLQACASDSQAPVIDGWKQNSKAGGDYRVQPGDTVYSTAWAFGMDYHDLVRYNQLSEPYNLHAGQLLHMYPSAAATQPPSATTSPVTAVSTPAPAAVPTTQTTQVISSPSTQAMNAKPKEAAPQTVKTATPAVVVVKPVVAASAVSGEKWLWPTKGNVVRDYSPAAGGNHGLDIAGKLNQPISASAAGKVVYAGSGMPGYGNLIIIKHSENDLSAYAYNKTINVKEGDMVKAGQCIAYMGKNDAGQTLLHFEIRRDGKPVDPKHYLK